jgi:hypothetical protein
VALPFFCFTSIHGGAIKFVFRRGRTEDLGKGFPLQLSMLRRRVIGLEWGQPRWLTKEYAAFVLVSIINTQHKGALLCNVTIRCQYDLPARMRVLRNLQFVDVFGDVKERISIKHSLVIS